VFFVSQLLWLKDLSEQCVIKGRQRIRTLGKFVKLSCRASNVLANRRRHSGEFTLRLLPCCAMKQALFSLGVTACSSQRIRSCGTTSYGVDTGTKLIRTVRSRHCYELKNERVCRVEKLRAFGSRNVEVADLADARQK
jgi:hypothetical protein